MEHLHGVKCEENAVVLLSYMELRAEFHLERLVGQAITKFLQFCSLLMFYQCYFTIADQLALAYAAFFRGEFSMSEIYYSVNSCLYSFRAYYLIKTVQDLKSILCFLVTILL